MTARTIVSLVALSLAAHGAVEEPQEPILLNDPDYGWDEFWQDRQPKPGSLAQSSCPPWLGQSSGELQEPLLQLRGGKNYDKKQKRPTLHGGRSCSQR